MSNKINNSLVLVCSLFMLTCAIPAHAQFSIGGGLGYGIEQEDVGLNLRLMTTIDDQWRGSGDLLFYFDGLEDFTTFEVNLNAHFVFAAQEKFSAYALGGLNIYVLSFTGDGIENIATGSETGLNLGAGSQLHFTESISALGELRYAISDIDQLVINAGLLYQFGG